MIAKRKSPYLRDVYLAFLISDARRTQTDEYPIIEKWMVSTEQPKEIIQWDRRMDVKDPASTAICFYCQDPGFQPILNNPDNYVNKLKLYQCVVGLDASPYDNMPIVVQKSQIFLNLACTYYYGKNGIKIIPNVRLGDERTISSLEAYPRNTLIAIGTHGFSKKLESRYIFAEQMQKVVDILEPSGICVYGPATSEILGWPMIKGIPIFQYDSFTMKENAKDKKNRLIGASDYER